MHGVNNRGKGIEMYSKADFMDDCRMLFGRTEGNIVEVPGIGETVLFEEPLIGFASASDGIFEVFRQKEVIGANYFSPAEWLPEAQTVVSFFLPFTETVRASNREGKVPSKEWLYARIEGQEFIGKYMSAIKQHLEECGIGACVPSMDDRFGLKIEITAHRLRPDFHADSRWSERHAAYACGLGTFSLSRGLITEKGMAGRFASVIITEAFEADKRDYTGIDDYCIRCGACAKKCPANAITLKNGKNNIRCRLYVESMRKKYSPRYGCGKCQVGVPCEFRSPRDKINDNGK